MMKNDVKNLNRNERNHEYPVSILIYFNIIDQNIVMAFYFTWLPLLEKFDMAEILSDSQLHVMACKFLPPLRRQSILT